MSDKWKQLVDLIVNEEEQKASELFHEIVIENSREIYENLISQDDVAETTEEATEEKVEEVSQDEVKDFEKDIKGRQINTENPKRQARIRSKTFMIIHQICCLLSTTLFAGRGWRSASSTRAS